MLISKLVMSLKTVIELLVILTIFCQNNAQTNITATNDNEQCGVDMETDDQGKIFNFISNFIIDYF